MRDTVAIFDGEPIGGLLDVSYGENVFEIRSAIYSLIGLKKTTKTTPTLFSYLWFQFILKLNL